jgi:hypothetical protein
MGDCWLSTSSEKGALGLMVCDSGRKFVNGG